MLKIIAILIIFLFLINISYGQQQDSMPNDESADVKKEKMVTAKWKLEMVHNVRWNSSKNFAFVHRVRALDQKAIDPNNGKEHNGRMHLGSDPCACSGTANCGGCPLGEAEMSFPVFMNNDNMLIKFHLNENDGVAYCEFGMFPEEIVDNIILVKSYFTEHCSFKRKWYNSEIEEKRKNEKKGKNSKKSYIYIYEEKSYAFCPLDDLLGQRYPNVHYPVWKLANGMYNKPSKTVQCLYDFHQVAQKRTFEYDLFTYCAKAYFFQGKDYNDPARLSKYRKDWLLFLANGNLVCGLSGKAEDDRALLANGYKIELVHVFDQHRFYPELELCPELEAILATYEVKNAAGDFLLGAVVGSAQLDGDFKWKYVEQDAPDGDKGIQKKRRFWDEKTYRNEYEDMTLDNRLCYLLYHKMMKWNNGPHKNRFRLQLRITHYCTERGMRNTTSFDVSIGPNQPPDNIYEDREIVINLNEGIMMRSTGQKLCAIGMPQKMGEECEIPPVPERNKNLAEHASCDHSHECGRNENTGEALKCRKEESLSCLRPIQYRPFFGLCKTPEKATCEYFLWRIADPPAKCHWNDLSCHDDQYCFSRDGQYECRKLRFKQENEMCFASEECFPPRTCNKLKVNLLETNDFGACVPLA